MSNKPICNYQALFRFHPITESGEYNYEYMESFITIQEKGAIQKVIEWKDRIISNTKQAIRRR